MRTKEGHRVYVHIFIRGSKDVPHGPHTGRTERRRSRGHSRLRVKKYKTRDPTRGPRSSASEPPYFLPTLQEYGNELCPARTSAECKICNALSSACLSFVSACARCVREVRASERAPSAIRIKRDCTFVVGDVSKWGSERERKRETRREKDSLLTN